MRAQKTRSTLPRLFLLAFELPPDYSNHQKGLGYRASLKGNDVLTFLADSELVRFLLLNEP